MSPALSDSDASFVSRLGTESQDDTSSEDDTPLPEAMESSNYTVSWKTAKKMSPRMRILRSLLQVRQLNMRAACNLGVPPWSDKLKTREATESFMLQCVGEEMEVPCLSCQTGSGPFKTCVVVTGKGNISGSCANCHFRHRACHCSFRSGEKQSGEYVDPPAVSSSSHKRKHSAISKKLKNTNKNPIGQKIRGHDRPPKHERKEREDDDEAPIGPKMHGHDRLQKENQRKKENDDDEDEGQDDAILQQVPKPSVRRQASVQSVGRQHYDRSKEKQASTSDRKIDNDNWIDSEKQELLRLGEMSREAYLTDAGEGMAQQIQECISMTPAMRKFKRARAHRLLSALDFVELRETAMLANERNM